MASLELESPTVPISVQAGCRTIVSDRRIYSNALIVSEELTNKVVAWATEIASYAARLPSKQARDAYLRERRRELVTGAQAEGATVCDAAIVADDRGKVVGPARPSRGTRSNAFQPLWTLSRDASHLACDTVTSSSVHSRPQLNRSDRG